MLWRQGGLVDPPPPPMEGGEEGEVADGVALSELMRSMGGPGVEGKERSGRRRP